MPEMFKAMKLLNGLGLAREVALVTDGRFSGTNKRLLCGAHLPRSQRAEGPIALVQG